MNQASQETEESFHYAFEQDLNNEGLASDYLNEWFALKMAIERGVTIDADRLRCLAGEILSYERYFRQKVKFRLNSERTLYARKLTEHLGSIRPEVLEIVDAMIARVQKVCAEPKLDIYYLRRVVAYAVGVITNKRSSETIRRSFGLVDVFASVTPPQTTESPSVPDPASDRSSDRAHR